LTRRLQLEKSLISADNLESVPSPFLAGMYAKNMGTVPNHDNVCKSHTAFYTFATKVGHAPVTPSNRAILQSGLACLSPKIMVLLEEIQKHPKENQFIYLPTSKKGYGRKIRELLVHVIIALVDNPPISLYSDRMSSACTSGRTLFCLVPDEEEDTAAKLVAAGKCAGAGFGNIIIGAREHYASIDLKNVTVIHELGVYDEKVRKQLRGRGNRRCALVGTPPPWKIKIFRYMYKSHLVAPQFQCNVLSDSIYRLVYNSENEMQKIIELASWDHLGKEYLRSWHEHGQASG
jgi:hypothetical protein